MGRRKYYISVRASWPGTWFGSGPKLPIERSRKRIAVGIPTNRSHPLTRKNEIVITLLATRALLYRGERMGSKMTNVLRPSIRFERKSDIARNTYSNFLLASIIAFLTAGVFFT